MPISLSTFTKKKQLLRVEDIKIVLCTTCKKNEWTFFEMQIFQETYIFLRYFAHLVNTKHIYDLVCTLRWVLVQLWEFWMWCVKQNWRTFLFLNIHVWHILCMLNTNLAITFLITFSFFIVVVKSAQITRFCKSHSFKLYVYCIVQKYDRR